MSNYLGTFEKFILINMTKGAFVEMFGSSVLAGVAIAVGGFVNLALGGIAGAVFFTFGLLTVVHYRLKLYTGVVGFIDDMDGFWQSFLILAGNIVGCLLTAWLARLSPMDLQGAAQKILDGRLAIGPLRAGALAIGCGFIVTTAVTFGRQEKWLPLLFGVPTFILCGFPHCIADAFYYLAVPCSSWHGQTGAILLLYVGIVIGNFIGCNLFRILVHYEKK